MCTDIILDTRHLLDMDNSRQQRDLPEMGRNLFSFFHSNSQNKLYLACRLLLKETSLNYDSIGWWSWEVCVFPKTYRVLLIISQVYKSLITINFLRFASMFNSKQRENGKKKFRSKSVFGDDITFILLKQMFF